jgi:hypothetical protein
LRAAPAPIRRGRHSRPPARSGGGEDDVALIVGIEDYAILPDVEGADANANDWVRWFERTRGLRPDRVVHLRNNEGTPRTVLAKAAQLAEAVGPRGRIWAVFIGHGAPSEDERGGVLVGWGAQQTALELYANSISQTELLRALGKGTKAPITMIIDACFSGIAADGSALARGLQPLLLTEREDALPPQVTLLSAGRPDQFAGPLPGASRPAFSYLLLGALRGWGDDPQYGDGDRQVTTDEAIAFVRAVLRATLKGRNQTPQVAGAAAVLANRVTEGAPDLSELKKLPGTHGTSGKERLGGGAGSVGDGLDLSTLDLDALGEAQRLKEAIDEAKATEARADASPAQKAAAWDLVATLRVKGLNPYADDARSNAESWRDAAVKLEELRTNWTKLREALRLSVLDIEQKNDLVEHLLAAYPGLATAPEYQEALRAKKALEAGQALPFGADRSLPMPAVTHSTRQRSEDPSRITKTALTHARLAHALWTKSERQTEATKADARRRKISNLLLLVNDPSHTEKEGAFLRLAETLWQQAVFEGIGPHDEYERLLLCLAEGRCKEVPVEPHVDQTSAVAYYRKTLETNPSYVRNDQALYYLGAGQIETGRAKNDTALVAEGEAALRKLCLEFSSSPFAALAHLRLADLFFESGAFPRATTNYEAAIQGQLTNLEREYAVYKIGWSDFHQAKLESAITRFLSVLEGLTGRSDAGSAMLRVHTLSGLATARRARLD